jgi:hypothetical protein
MLNGGEAPPTDVISPLTVSNMANSSQDSQWVNSLELKVHPQYIQLLLRYGKYVYVAHDPFHTDFENISSGTYLLLIMELIQRFFIFITVYLDFAFFL